MTMWRPAHKTFKASVCQCIGGVTLHVQSSGKHKVQMLPGLMELFILLFAHDEALLATTPSKRQNQLNCLRDCFVKMKNT